MLFEIQEEEAIDAIEEERIWSQIVQNRWGVLMGLLVGYRCLSTWNDCLLGDTRPIPSPSDEQLKELEKLNERARRRVRDTKTIHQEIARLLDEKAAMTASGLHFHWFYREQLQGIEQDLVWLYQDLRDIEKEQETDVAKEKEIWNQSVEHGESRDLSSLPTLGSSALLHPFSIFLRLPMVWATLGSHH
ncbi:hypothetical protein PCH_Pc15g02000 [Penicillium rubens Wisconsin 54-1255]|uniref:Uncharacterized protein n=1 Tax=Penicillium rubens (strain ATCC 28089 / DSM 1075 / NRRL 1951 / Wisconsin 54-1255) TaxID=500485 RepID=B6H6D4_PENRW|nr:hypothetical protein PCH_Pc15g02000 [Penicillium rubens Wisconsin 54-1255]